MKQINRTFIQNVEIHFAVDSRDVNEKGYKTVQYRCGLSGSGTWIDL